MTADILVRDDRANVRFRYLADIQKGRLPSPVIDSLRDRECLPYLTMEYLRGESAEPTLVPIDDRVIMASNGSTLLLWDGANAGEFFRAKRGVVSSTTALITPRSIDPNFFYWACKGQEDRLRAQTVGMGIPHVNGELLANIRIGVPPLAEQRAIADYLDRETARIDALVAAKERVLALLAERCRVFMTHAVTRGIDPATRLRYSGVPWLGDVPAHWEIERAKWLFVERDERSHSGDEELLTVSHSSGVTFRSEKDVNMFESATTAGYKLCIAGDLVVNPLWAWMGAMGVSPVNGIVSPAYKVYVPGPRLEPSYIDALVRLPVFAQEVARHSKGDWSSRLRLYLEGLFKISLPLPPLREQDQIVAAVSCKTSPLDHLRIETESSITLLKERRSALIAAAVTGQTDIGRPA